MDLAVVQRIAHELGVTPARVDQLRRMPFEQAATTLEAMKKEAKANYRKLAFKYHPDRNPGNAEAEISFRALGEVLKQIEALQVQRPRPQPIVFVQIRHDTPQVVHFHVRPNTSTSTTTYDARRAAFIKF